MSTLEQGLNLKVKANQTAILDLSLPGNAAHWSYCELETEIERIADALIELGAKSDDVVAFAIKNSIEFVVTFIAVARIGAIAAPLNYAYKESEFLFYIKDSNARFLIVTKDGNTYAESVCKDLNCSIMEIGLHAQEKRFFLQKKFVGKSVLDPNDNDRFKKVVSPDSVCLILHTSGTTSRPKAVPLTQNNLITSVRNIQATYELNDKDSSLLVMPLFHIHGLVCGLLSPLSVGAKIVIPSNGIFSASKFWIDAVEHKITWFTAVPTILQVLLMRASTDYPYNNPPPLRFIRSCSSSLAASVMQSLETCFGVPVLEAYAMTEASHQMTSNPLHNERVPGSVGIPQNVNLVILDSEGKQLGVGETGEVCIKGDNVTKGYLNNFEANKEAFRFDWFHTGDLGFKNEKGYLTLVGRIKELINRGGEKISPVELDAFLLTHPAVAEAVAFGGPDEKYGEIVYCAVTLKPDQSATEDDILEYCRNKLVLFKVPKRVFIAPLGELPKTATGKIQRRHVASYFLKNVI